MTDEGWNLISEWGYNRKNTDLQLELKRQLYHLVAVTLGWNPFES